MLPRDPDEGHRAASSLELFFDLVFVVAVGFAATDLHHIEVEGHIGSAVLGYAFLFFAIWWAWMNFTWFATSFDTDDWLYRVTTIVQMAGVLVLAAGVHAAMVEHDYRVVVVGYVVMRLAMVSQWLRAARAASAYRVVARRYAVGIAVVQVLWVLWVFVPAPVQPFVVPFLVACELAVPPVAERAHTTPWHPHHITERYGLFTLIVLGEGLVASANAVIDAVGHAEHLAPLLVLAACGLVITAGLWWVYFSREQQEALASFPRALVFGYGHWFVFAAAGALPAGIEVAVAADAGEADLSHASVAATVAVPVAVFLLAVQALALRRGLGTAGNVTVTALALAVAATVLVPSVSLVLIAACVAAVVVVVEVTGRRTAV
ncbi:MAG: low temperature requirement protein A [Williamsia herbipolensis]|nr:low temperature requirement protein A [Williamsia herbipolensis]